MVGHIHFSLLYPLAPWLHIYSHLEIQGCWPSAEKLIRPNSLGPDDHGSHQGPAESTASTRRNPPDFCVVCVVSPLVNIQKAVEHGHIASRFSYQTCFSDQTWWFAILMLVFQKQTCSFHVAGKSQVSKWIPGGVVFCESPRHHGFHCCHAGQATWLGTWWDLNDENPDVFFFLAKQKHLFALHQNHLAQNLGRYRSWSWKDWLWQHPSCRAPAVCSAEDTDRCPSNADQIRLLLSTKLMITPASELR